MSDSNNSSLRVVVTRPAGQSERLAELIQAEGGTAIRIPALEISAAPQPAQVKARFENLAHYDYLVFISPNAVRFSLAYFTASQLHEQKTVAIGASTANAMEMAGIRCDIYPRHSFTSEALLVLPEFAKLQGKNILIVRGIGGRELLGREFQNRGASVDYAEVYQRSIPADSKALLNAVLGQDGADLVTANSVETLVNIVTITEDQWRDKLLHLQLVTGSARVVQEAAELGFEHPPLLADGPDDESLMKAISAWSPTPRAAHEITESAENKMTQDKPDPDAQIPQPPRDDGAQQANSMSDSRADSKADPKVSSTTGAKVAAATAASGTETTAGSHAAAPDAELTEVVSSGAPLTRHKSGRGVAWLALLVALLACAASGWTWWQSLREQNAIADIKIPTAAEILADVREESARDNGQVTRQLDRQEQQLADAIGQHSDFAASIRTQKRSVETLTSQLGQMESSISAMRGVSANVRNVWVRAETEYFLQIANTRLQLANDINSAVQALRAADERIVALGDPALTPVRAQISEELLALESVPPIDIEGIALTLNSVARGINKLTLKNSAPDSLGHSANQDAGQSGWGRAKGVISNAFTDIVRVSPTGDSHAPLLAPDQAFFLYRNIELQLQAARIAAMQQQQQNYTNSLLFAIDWIRRYFDPADSGVAVVIQRLEQLRGQKVSVEMPDISGSLNMLRNLAPERSVVPRSPATGNSNRSNESGEAS